MHAYSLSSTEIKLKGPTKEQIITQNQWAAVALDQFHSGSSAIIELEIEGIISNAQLSWSSNFSKAAMREAKDIANQGGVALAWFVMSVIKGYGYVEQTEIGDGVDYFFKVNEPNDEELNFLDEAHYVEVSGLLKETKGNTLKKRVDDKHKQIDRGEKRDKPSSVIVTLFSHPKTIKEVHK